MTSSVNGRPERTTDAGFAGGVCAAASFGGCLNWLTFVQAKCVEAAFAMSSQQRPDYEPGRGDTLVEPTVETKKPSLYQVLLLNDDYTPMEFVVMILEQFFRKDREEATQIMLHVHQNGVGVCGVYTYEVAESKVTQVVNCAREHEHPLRCTLEKV